MDQTRAVIRIIEEVLVREIEASVDDDGGVDINIDAVLQAIERELTRRQVRLVWGSPGPTLVGGLA